MSDWVYFLHPPRENFVETITEEEAATMGVHRDHLGKLLDEGVLIMAGPTFGPVNTGIAARRSRTMTEGMPSGMVTRSCTGLPC